MVKTLTKHGNSWALVIDKPIMELLKIDPTTPLEVTTDGKSLNIAPASDAKRRSKFTAAVEDTVRKYPKMLKRLAE
jgi:antitoxin component of MazEF toxin-antitoxin module